MITAIYQTPVAPADAAAYSARGDAYLAFNNADQVYRVAQKALKSARVAYRHALQRAKQAEAKFASTPSGQAEEAGRARWAVARAASRAA